MRAVVLLLGSLLAASAARALPLDDFAARLAGPWGHVSATWAPLTGALSKTSCPYGGVARRENVGLFGEGGAIWIEAAAGGGLNVYDGGPLPRLFQYVEVQGPASVLYREAGVERLLTLVSPDRLTQGRVPAVPGLPVTNFARCAKKR
ncbi:MAG: hypothetical protein K8S25_03485 [Alphaproteobacteria bacterium]|nr:hypothetical protein [Alphaproteobacteria bacterium]